MLNRFVNSLLLGLMVLLGASGVVVLYGTWQPWVTDLHRVAGWALIALAPWKGVIVVRSLRRGLEESFDRGFIALFSIAMMVVILLTLGLGVAWAWRLGPYQGPLGQTILAWHWILALAVAPFFVLHLWRRWPQPRRADFSSRRAALRMLALGGAGLLGWFFSGAIARSRTTENRPRRSATGSRGFGLFQGNAFPFFGEATVQTDPAAWRLAVAGAVREPLLLSYDELLALPGSETAETLDCTSGWYTVQDWGGVPLMGVVAGARPPGRIAGVRLISATGYNHVFPYPEAQGILLATHVGGETLAPRHGFPLRAVVPNRRGWFWVKWLTRIEVLEDPLAVLGGTLWSPREVLRQW
jgi:DMSO/TMAO reductase YedYZ molybdopterin-dependent catalytic subunit